MQITRPAAPSVTKYLIKSNTYEKSELDHGARRSAPRSFEIWAFIDYADNIRFD
jgi:hypothetical protein